jgi:hypothetical protein
MVGAANRHSRPTLRDKADSSAGSKPPEAGTRWRAARAVKAKLYMPAPCDIGAA